MVIKKFKIQHYKSIKDSGYCFLSEDNITTLAGRNESGKSSILEALEDFNYDKAIREEAVPINDDENTPVIEVVFEVEKDQLSSILEDAGIEAQLKKDKYVITLIKNYPESYEFEPESIKFLDLQASDNTKALEEIEINRKDILALIEGVPQIPPELMNNLKVDDVKTAVKQVEDFRTQGLPHINHIPDEAKRNQFDPLTKQLLDKLNALSKAANPIETFTQEFLQYTPQMILFSSFEDVFPNKIPANQLKDNEWISDLSQISDLKVDKLTNKNKQIRSKHTTDLNIEVNEQYKQFWTQDDIEMKVEVDNEELLFWIYENDYPYMPSQRSKGQQWHLAFYIKVTARAKDEVNNVILIDEPGLYLHATAQRDILNKLEDIAKEVQVIFSTHSSYLLEYEKIHRVKLISKNKKTGTVIDNKIHALADKETLTPILTAIGLELTSGIESLDKKDNVVTEGQSDVYYLSAFKMFLKEKGYKFNFIFGGGAGNMPIVGTILHGWGCSVLYLYDNDQGKKDGQKNLKNNWNVKDEVLSITEQTGSIEDLFTEDDFKKYVLEDESLDYKSSNSVYMKKSKREKVLTAKLFLERYRKDKSKFDFSEDTKNNFSKLLDKINKFYNE